MIRINLLPYRENLRKERRQAFFRILIGVVILGLGVSFAAYTVIQGYVSIQEGKNSFLRSEITRLDKKIDEIRQLKEKTQALLSRKQVVESLQQDRADTVRILNEMAKQMPEGVYVRSIKQDGLRLSLNGVAQSSARISSFMRNLDESPWFGMPVLVEIKASVPSDKKRVDEFLMNVSLTREALPPAGGDKK